MLTIAAIILLMGSNTASPEKSHVDSGAKSEERVDFDSGEEIVYGDEELGFEEEDELAYDDEEPLDVQEIVFDDEADMDSEDSEQDD